MEKLIVTCNNQDCINYDETKSFETTGVILQNCIVSDYDFGDDGCNFYQKKEPPKMTVSNELILTDIEKKKTEWSIEKIQDTCDNMDSLIEQIRCCINIISKALK